MTLNGRVAKKAPIEAVIELKVPATGLALRADLEDSVWSPGGVSKWLAPPVKVHAALNQKICNIQDLSLIHISEPTRPY